MNINQNKEKKIENEKKEEKNEKIDINKEEKNKNEIEIKEEKKESDDKNLLKTVQNKKEEKKVENEEDIDDEEEEEEEDDDEEEDNKNSEPLKTKVSKSVDSKDLTKYELLIQIINKNLEAKGFSKSDIKKEIDVLYNSLPDPLSSEDLFLKLNENLIKLLGITLDSDKIEIEKFIKELISIFENDKNKIYEQLMNFIEIIEDQEKLKTRKLNRNIRSYLKDCEEKIKNKLKEEDIPSDKIITFEKFFKIVEETGIKLKEEYMQILLYQMKIAVPKGKSINTLNANVIVDFLK